MCGVAVAMPYIFVANKKKKCYNQSRILSVVEEEVKCTHKTGHKVCVNHRKSQVIDSRFMGILNIRQ